MQIERQLKELELFLEAVEKFLDNQADRAESEDERRKLEDYFPNLLRSSLFVTIYAAVENHLNRLCRRLAKGDGLAVEDLRGNGIIRAGTFLSKVCRVDFPWDSEEWNQLKEYNQLRNILVHNDGRDQGNHLKQLVESSSGLEVKEDGAVHLQRQFCPEVLETVRKFFAKLEAAL
ncbi:MAG: hypothetical protein ACOX2G_10500 [Bacillota bacterium]